MDNHDAARENILEAALAHVPFDGWTDTALRAGAADAGYGPDDLARFLPGGPAELMELFNTRADAAMLAELDTSDLDAMRVRERIALGVRLRLEANDAHREAIRRGLAFLAMPQNAPLALKCLHRTVDAIWRAAGDTATDYNYYTKRGLLAGVYAATLLYWLGDDSAERARSWAFLDRRIADAMRLPQSLARIKERLPPLPDLAAIFRHRARRQGFRDRARRKS